VTEDNLTTKTRRKSVPANGSRTSTKTARTSRKLKADTSKLPNKLLDLILKSLDDDKAEDIVLIDLSGKTIVADAMVVATGRSARHVSAIAEHVAEKVKAAGYGSRPIEGLATGDWVLVDAGDVVVHIFRPEVRAFYDIESMWQSGSDDRVAV
jgi:ribosome silencing factor RsfS/YbeB/iojap